MGSGESQGPECANVARCASVSVAEDEESGERGTYVHAHTYMYYGVLVIVVLAVVVHATACRGSSSSSPAARMGSSPVTCSRGRDRTARVGLMAFFLMGGGRW